jgi:hypothetical protein
VYNKLFAKIVDSTVWLQPTPTRIVWVTFLAVMDEDGFVALASVPNVARRAAVSLEEAAQAVACLEGPDPDSSDPDHDGRRVERVPGGWMVLNAAKYSEIVTRTVARERTKERVRKHRDRKKEKPTCNAPVTVGNGPVTPSDSYSESGSDTEEDVQASRSEALAVRKTDRQEAAGGFETFWQVYPRRTGKQAALAVWRRLRPDASLQARILQAVREQAASEQWLKDGGQFIPHPRTWLSQGRWDDEPVQVPQVSEKTAKTLTAGARWLAKQNQKENPT